MNVDDDTLYVIDTDCGGDDAIALMLALMIAPNRIIAITCSSGNTNTSNVCDNVRKVITAYAATELKIPVYKGSDVPLVYPYKPEDDYDVHGETGLGDCGDDWSTGKLEVCDEPAAVALARLSAKHPRKIVLIALAPLMNVILAHRLYPKFTEHLKGIVCMGGNYKGQGNITETAEFNFFYDPESAHILMTEAKCPITLVPWETTMEFGIEWDDYEKMIKATTKRGIFFKCATAGVARFCRQNGDTMFLDCDFLAAVAALRPDSVTDQFATPMAVEYVGQHTRGLTIPLRSEGKKINIITKFDVNILKELRKKMLED